MTIYTADIRSNGVQRLNTLFSEEPFSVKETSNQGQFFVGYNGPEFEDSIMGYSSDQICIFYHWFDQLPTNRMKQVCDKLATENSLDHVVTQVRTHIK